MALERTELGLEARFRSRGAGRFIGAAFLLVWLCGWAVGEAIVLWLLVRGAYAIVTATPPGPGREPLEPGPALAVGAFLLLWLTLWTVGGVMALLETLRLIAGEDRVIAGADGITLVQRRGPFTWRKQIPRDRVRRIEVAPRRGALAIESDRGRVEATQLGSREERAEAAVALRAELAIPEGGPAGLVELPEGWEQVISPEGDRTLVPDLATRRRQARVMIGLAVAAGALAIGLAADAVRRPERIALAVVVGIPAVAMAWGATWLARGRMEWKIGGGRIMLRRRFGSQLREVFESRRLELSTSTDSDGDLWYALEALGVDPSKPETPKRRSIARTMNDPTVTRRLAGWLSRHGEIPLEDRSQETPRVVDLAQLKVQLEGTGTLGRFAARLIERAEKHNAR